MSKLILETIRDELKAQKIIDAEGVSYSPIFGQISGVFKLLPAPADRFHCC
jgi:hypothetical protein